MNSEPSPRCLALPKLPGQRGRRSAGSGQAQTSPWPGDSLGFAGLVYPCPPTVLRRTTETARSDAGSHRAAREGARSPPRTGPAPPFRPLTTWVNRLAFAPPICLRPPRGGCLRAGCGRGHQARDRPVMTGPILQDSSLRFPLSWDPLFPPIRLLSDRAMDDFFIYPQAQRRDEVNREVAGLTRFRRALCEDYREAIDDLLDSSQIHFVLVAA